MYAILKYFLKSILVMYSTIWLNRKSKFLRIHIQSFNFESLKKNIFKEFCLILHNVINLFHNYQNRTVMVFYFNALSKINTAPQYWHVSCYIKVYAFILHVAWEPLQLVIMNSCIVLTNTLWFWQMS